MRLLVSWLPVLTDLRDRGVTDARGVFCGRLSGLPDAGRPHALGRTRIVRLPQRLPTRYFSMA